MKNRRFWSWALILLSAAALLLEALPWGVAMRFMADPASGEAYTLVYCSYFDPILFGYAVWGPIAAGVLTLTALVLAVVYLVKGKTGWMKAFRTLAGVACAASLSPFLLGMQLTVIGTLVTALLLIGAMLAYYLIKPVKKNKIEIP